MELHEALVCLADGHSVFSEEGARSICAAVGVSFPEPLVICWQGQADAFRVYGFYPLEDGPGSGIESLELSYYVAEALGLGAPGSGFTGKGLQARANAQAIAGKLSAVGRLMKKGGDAHEAI